MKAPSQFEWDETKASSNLEKHGVRFAYAASVFLDPDLATEATIRPQDGEARYKAIGSIDGKLYAVVFVMIGDVCRLISARRTNIKEDRIYGLR